MASIVPALAQGSRGVQLDSSTGPPIYIAARPRPGRTDMTDSEPKEDEPAEEEKPRAKSKSKSSKGRSLVIVESPAKAKTINKYLGKDFVVKASMGHIRDLPKGKFGIDIESGFKPDYTTIRGKGKVISELRKLAKSAPSVYLAPDLDREGEAIAWHLSESLGVGEEKIFRVVFNEITKKAILEAFSEPGKLNMDKVDAQQARRVLDRIMGYKLSPLLWKKIAKGLSAGRVQSVAVRLIVEREQRSGSSSKRSTGASPRTSSSKGRSSARSCGALLTSGSRRT